MKAVALFLLIILFFGTTYAGSKITSSVSSPQFFIVDSWISGFTYGICTKSEKRWKTAWHRANRTAGNDLKIWGGLFVSDPNRKLAGRMGEIFSRFTYQAPQNTLGFLYGHFENTIAGNVDTVRYKYGATVLTGRRGLFFDLGGLAITLGGYIAGNSRLHANANNFVFQHEFGHYLQSQRMGTAWFGTIAIPNIRSEHGNYQKNYSSHDFHPTEQDANRRAFLYFNEKLPDFQDDHLHSNESSAANKGWDFVRNPLSKTEKLPTGQAKNQPIYVDFKNAQQVASMNQLRVRPKLHDYLLPLISGLYNSYRYNH